MSFIAQNWDKLVGILVSIVIAGVIGFFSAIGSIRGEISSLETEVRTLQTLVNDSRDSQREGMSSLTDRCKTLDHQMVELIKTSTESITVVHEIQGTIDIRVLNAINNQMSRAELVRAPR